MVETINGDSLATSYVYNDRNMISVCTVGNIRVTYGYDTFDRLTTKYTEMPNGAMIVEAYTYKVNADGTATDQVATYSVTANNQTTTYAYTYDDNGNIKTVTTGGKTTTYTYDRLNQLIREDNEAGGYSCEWEYDEAGNIVACYKYNYTTGNLGSAQDFVDYYYEDYDWGDLLTYCYYRGAYGAGVSHDEIGNMLSDGERTYTWQNGRELATLTKDGKTWHFAYDADGMRTGRLYGNTYYKYAYNGGQLSWMVIDKNLINNVVDYTLRFTYDASGAPVSVTYNGVLYYYVTNLQGDVVAILDSTGATVVTYSYDAWGKLLSTTDTTDENLGYHNPLRYRGYVYDNETGLYYLQSRYYNPEIGRFISADSPDYLGADGALTSYNLFAYCGNNPVMGYDPSGHFDWTNFSRGAGWLSVGIAAICISVTILSCGAAAPAMTAVAVLTLGAGGLTTINGAAEIGEAFTDYNFVRDTVFGGDQASYDLYANITATAAEIGTSILGSYYTAKGGNVCFVAGTLVQGADGPVPIESVEAGDLVWAWDEETGEVALKRVVQTFVNEATELVCVTVKGEEIVCTTEHPFYSPVKGWTAACKLRAGDILVTVNGEYVVVEKIQHEILEAPIAVYNFEVEGFHTYYVSDTAVLVHNACGGRGELRANMLKAGPAPGPNYQAHHGLPWKNRGYFSQAGLDVNDAKFGRWVLGGGSGGHQSWSRRYGALWDDYIARHPIPDASDIIDYFRKLNGL